MTSWPVHPYNRANYPHEWLDVGGMEACAGCGIPRERIAPDDPYPCRAAIPTLNADGSIKETT